MMLLASRPATPFGPLRLAVWRELRASAPWTLGLLGLLLLDRLLPVRARGAWDLFALLLVLPPLAMGMALRGPAPADSFWRGLGHGRAAEAVRAGLQITMLLATGGLLLASLSGRGESLRDLVDVGRPAEAWLALLFALHAVTWAGRVVADRTVALAGVLAAGPALWVATLVAASIDRWPTVGGLSARLLIVGGVAWVLALAGVHTGAWGGAVRRRGWRIGGVVVGLLATVGGTLAVEAAWPLEWTLAKAEWRDVAPDGSAAFRAMRAPYPAPPEGTWRDESGRWGRWTEDAGLESTAPARRRVVGPTSAAFAGEQVWSVADGRLWIGLGERRSPIDLGGIELLEVWSARGRVYARGRAGEASVVLARIGAEWIELHRGAEWSWFFPLNGCFYERSSRQSHCFDARGRELLAAEVPLATLVGDGWLHDRAGHAVFRPFDGARVALPGPVPDLEDVDRGRLVLLPAGGLRYFAPNGRVHDVELPGGP